MLDAVRPVDAVRLINAARPVDATRPVHVRDNRIFNSINCINANELCVSEMELIMESPSNQRLYFKILISLLILKIYRGFHEKGTNSYLGTKG